MKTSILILDKRVHKQTDKVLFVKVQNDGFNLGAQRRAVVDSHLPEATRLLRSWMVAPDKFEGDGVMAQAVERGRIGASGDFNLSGERYVVSKSSTSSFPMVELGSVLTFVSSGATPKGGSETYLNEGVLFIRSQNILSGSCDFSDAVFISEATHKEMSRSRVQCSDVFLNITGASIGRSAVMNLDCSANVNQHVALLRPNESLLPVFLSRYLNSDIGQRQIRSMQGGASREALNYSQIRQLQIPLPPLEVQHQIVAEIEGYQKIIDGARQVLDNYQPHIVVSPDWNVKPLTDITECVSDGDHQAPPKSDDGVPFVTISNIDDQNRLDFSKTFFVPQTYFDQIGATRRPQRNDTLYSVTGSFGIPVFVDSDKQFCFQRHIALLRPSPAVDAKYLYLFMSSPLAFQQAEKAATGVAQKTVSLGSLRNFQIPLPTLEIQHAIVAEIEAEQALVNANRELIRRMEAKVKAAIGRVWGLPQVIGASAD